MHRIFGINEKDSTFGIVLVHGCYPKNWNRVHYYKPFQYTICLIGCIAHFIGNEYGLFFPIPLWNMPADLEIAISNNIQTTFKLNINLCQT